MKEADLDDKINSDKNQNSNNINTNNLTEELIIQNEDEKIKAIIIL